MKVPSGERTHGSCGGWRQHDGCWSAPEVLSDSPTPALCRSNGIPAVLMLAAASMAGVAVTGTLPVLFGALVLVLTVAPLGFALRGRIMAG